MAEKIKGTDTLRQAYPKLNGMIDEVNYFQKQLNEIVVEGDSSVEAAQARVDADGNTYTNLKERLDTIDEKIDQNHDEVSAQLAQIPKQIDTAVEPKADKNYVDEKLSDISVSQINKNKGKIDQTYLSDELLQQIAGTAEIYAVPAIKSVDTLRIADKAITPELTSFLRTGKNLFDKDDVIHGYYLNSSGNLSPYEYAITSQYIPVKAGQPYTLSWVGYSALYDNSRTFIPGTYQNYSDSSIPATITPSEDGFLRVSVNTAYIDQCQVERGSSATPYEPYRISIPKLYKRVITDDIEEKAVTPEKTNFISLGKNLFNKATAVKGYYVNSNGNLSSSESYFTSDYIPVIADQSYTLSWVGYLALYDKNKGFINGTHQANPTSENPVTITPSEDGFLRVSIYESFIEKTQVEKGANATNYEPYGLTIPDLIFSSRQKEYLNNPLSGKKLLGFGDSIGQGGGNSGISYIEMIAESNGMEYVNYSKGGATVAPREGYDNQIIKQINQSIANGDNADYIVFNGLTNDANVTPISRAGTITQGYNDTLDLDTFCGSFEHIVKTLMLNWPDAKILFVRVHKMNSRDSRQETFGELAVDICKKWSIPVVDMYHEGGLNAYLTEHINLYTYNGDSTHPNQLGYEMFYKPRIEAKLKSI